MSMTLSIDNSSRLKLELTTAQALCMTIDTPRALTVWLLLEHQEFEQYMDLECNPNHYNNPTSFRDDYLVTEVLKKSSTIPLEIDREQKAIDSFFESEASCRAVNDKLCSSVTRSKVIEKAKRIVRGVLGDLSKEDLRFVEESFRFGPGATTGVRGSGCVLSDKYDEEIHLTASLYPFYRAILGDRWWEIQKSPIVVPGNKFTTVPKNAKTNRGICIEPTLNIYGQLGIGALLRQRLKRLGIDLSDQTRNQALAKAAWSKSLATIDLSRASDSLAWSVVMEFLPHDWFELLDLFRSPYTTIKGIPEPIELEKFSSMGNGYTFELETLIFASIAHACTSPDDIRDCVAVYGDDIIVPQYAARRVIDALDFLGFSVNISKSFLAGSFYESCGTDWFCGQPVRPFYLRSTKDKIPYELQIANALRLFSRRSMNEMCCDSRFRPLWLLLVKLTPKPWRNCRVPASFGDVGVISSEDEARLLPSAGQGWQGKVVLYMKMNPIKRRKRTFGRLLAALACPDPEVATMGREPRRGFLGRPVPKKTVVSRWSSGFEWC